MSSLTDPIGAGLDNMVEAQRGMSDAEATRFLQTGELPNLLESSTEVEPEDVEVMSQGDARAFLAGYPLVVTAAVSANSLSLDASHDEIHIDDEIESSTDENTSSETPEDGVAVVEPTVKTEDLIAATEIHTGAMIALIPMDADAERLAVDGGEEPGQLHVTLGYLGEAALIPVEVKTALIECVTRCVADRPTIVGDVFAVSMFNPDPSAAITAGGGEPCVVLVVSGQQLPGFHDYVMRDVAQTFAAAGMELHPQHQPWVAHLTLVYTGDADLSYFTDRVGPVTFDRVRLAFGNDVYDIPLGESGIATSPIDETEDVTGYDNAETVTFAQERDVNIPSGPGHQLRDYWVRGPGAAKIGWGTPGDFTRCVANLSDKVKNPQGLCAEYHYMATGMWPGDKRNPGMAGDAVSLDSDVLYDGGGAEEGVDNDMPWHLEKRGNEWCVIKDADDSSAGCHSDRNDAISQLRALYADEPNMQTTTANVEDDCPPGHHKMSDGECMPDAEMPTKSYAITGQSASWRGVLTVEGIESGDGRMFAANALTWDEPPLPLMWQKETSHGGNTDKSVRVGSIERIWREPDVGGRADVFLIKGEGRLDLDNPDGAEVYRRMGEKFLRGNSVDVDSVKDADVELVYPEVPLVPDGEVERANDVMQAVFASPELTMYRKGRIRATTLVEIPAFTEARLELVDAVTAAAVAVDEDTIVMHSTETVEAAWDASAQEGRLPSPLRLGTARDMFAYVDTSEVENDTVPKTAGKLPHHQVGDNGTPGPANLTAVSAAIGALHGARGGLKGMSSSERRAAYDHLAGHLRDAGDEPPPFSIAEGRLAALTAATSTIQISDAPPREWFEEPIDVTPLGALTVTDEGRVYGYIAPAGVRHRSFAQRSQYVPLGNVDYGRFMGGETLVADGGRVATGAITMGCGHATTEVKLTGAQAKEHYDNTCSIVATARVGETENGVWMAGALLPDVTADQVRRIMACRLSGDWRTHLDHPGWREFVAALLVPVPGFPMARTSPSVATTDGQLVASSVPVRFVRTENAHTVVERPVDYRAKALAVAQRLGRDPVSRANALRERVTAQIGTERSTRLAALRQRVALHGTHNQQSHGNWADGPDVGTGVNVDADADARWLAEQKRTRAERQAGPYDPVVSTDVRPGDEIQGIGIVSNVRREGPRVILRTEMGREVTYYENEVVRVQRLGIGTPTVNE